MTAPAAFWIVAYVCGWYLTARWMVRRDPLDMNKDEGGSALTVIACWLWPVWLFIGAAGVVGKHLEKGADR